MTINPAHKSKINYTQLISAAVTVAAAFGLDITEETRSQILTVAGVVFPALTVIFRSFFTEAK